VVRKRRSFTPSFKAKVALEAVKEVKTISEIAQKHKLHPTQINLWKKQLLDGAEDVFLDGRTKKPSSATSDEPDAAELYEQIVLAHRKLESHQLCVSELNGCILSQISRHRAARFNALVRIPKGGIATRSPRESPPVLRSSPLSQRSGRTSALPYPPLRS